MTTALLAVTLGGVVVDIGRSLKEGLYMFYDTAWALVLGFSLSGSVQAFVSRASMQAKLPDHGPSSVARASMYGMVSSSCSYAASAMAKSLFQKGADFVASMAFMFASTNLVVELGIVLAVLIGWQFVAAEFVGGAIMIALLVLAGNLVFRGRSLAEATRNVGALTVASSPQSSDINRSWRDRIRSIPGWTDAANYTLADLKMLRRELIIGYGVAGFLSVLVPMHAWSDIFIKGHGVATTFENVAVGPLIAMISFVCSIGNVPLAAALWKGGISFGGVVSFIFADLIAMPLLFIYRKFYGTKMALRMLAVFWTAMSISGLIVEEIFQTFRIVPTTRPTAIVTEQLSWNSTAVLNIVFLLVFSTLYLLARRRPRSGPSTGFAFDPICHMQVEMVNAPASAEVEGTTIYFCSDRCKDRFTNDPKRYAHERTQPHLEPVDVRLSERVALSPNQLELGPPSSGPSKSVAIDPVCHMALDTTTALFTRTQGGVEYYFCCAGCATAFEDNPLGYLEVGEQPNL